MALAVSKQQGYDMKVDAKCWQCVTLKLVPRIRLFVLP